MTIEDIKAKVGLPELIMQYCLDEDDNETDWVRHWDNELRISVSMPEEVFDEIKKDRNRNDLFMTTAKKISKDKVDKEDETKVTKGSAYTHVVVFIPENLAGVL